MTRPDFKTQRLFVRVPLRAGAEVELDRAQANYLQNVLRMTARDTVLLFNGVDGEWRARLVPEGRRRAGLIVDTETRPQTQPADLDYLFAPLKQARLDYMVQKAVEMGVGRLRPVITQHTQVTRLNLARMIANAIEAAEQCGILTLPKIDEPVPLRKLIEAWPTTDADRRIIFCDEGEEGDDPLAILSGVGAAPLAVLIGPEGGFASEERAMLRAAPFVTALPLGPRILRADTAAVAALALIQAAKGDWRSVSAPIAGNRTRR